MRDYIEELKTLGACKEALFWCKSYPTLKGAWKNCERGDWMLWLMGRLSGSPESDSRKKVVLAACACARLALKYVPDGESRPQHAIDIAEAWARGESVMLQTVRDAAYAAYAAHPAHPVYAAAYAAYAAYAAHPACAAQAACTAQAAQKGVLKQCADIVRRHYPSVKLEVTK